MYAVEELASDARFLRGMRRSLHGGAPPPLLRDLKIKITSRCNLRCRMCGYWKTKTEETLTTEEWRRVLGEARALGARKVHFSGGEVFLRPDFLAVVEHAVGLGLKVNMTTNGTLIDQTKARRLRRIGVNSVSISLDGPDRESHQAVRGRDYAFKRSLKTIARLARPGPHRLKVRVNFVMMRDNFRRLPEMVELAARLGATDLVPMPVDEKGERRNRLSKAQILEYNRDIAPRVLELRRRHGFPDLFERVFPFGVTEEEVRRSKKGEYSRGLFERQSCLAPWLHAFIGWDGRVFLCCMTNGRIEPLGDVRHMTLREVFHGERFRKVRASFAALEHFPICARCDLFLSENARLHQALAEVPATPAPARLARAGDVSGS